MSAFKIFDVAGSAMSAQTTRLNTVASNLANAETAAGSPETAYRSRHPVFSTLLMNASGSDTGAAGVRVDGVTESTAPPRAEYRPGHPQADADGYVYLPNTNTVEEMADMMSASRSYQNSVEVLSTVKQLMLRTLQLGRG